MQLPEEFCKRMKEMLGSEYEAFIKTYDDEEHHVGLRINKAKCGDLFSDILRDCKKVEWCDEGYYCSKDIISGKHPYHVMGLCYFQEPSAMASVEALPVKTDDYILDLCAAPGGKSTQAGSRLSDEGLLVANEIIPKRSQILAQNIERFGFSNTIVTNENPEKLKERFPNFFDKIIVDAPCSGEGMFKKEPLAAVQWSINHTLTCAERQRHIMDCAYEMLKEGGYIVYSTCTFAPCENEGVIDYMLSEYPDLTLEKTGLDMLDEGRGEWVNSSHDLRECRRIFPHKSDGEGHFIALLKKQGQIGGREKDQIKADKDCETAKKLFYEFEKECLNRHFEGTFKLFGENLYLIPHGIDTDKLKLSLAGLHLGVCKKNRFEPSFALCRTLSKVDIKNTVDFKLSDIEVEKYMRGETIFSDVSGNCAVCVDNIPLGWAKGVDGVLKNHFPKHLGNV